MDEEVSTIRHVLVLRRVDAETNVHRFYALMIERDLFGRTVLVRHWGRIGSGAASVLMSTPARMRLRQPWARLPAPSADADTRTCRLGCAAL
jgi:predicted DNA-binding WGR domain protein